MKTCSTRRGSTTERLTPKARSALDDAMAAGEIARFADVQRVLPQRFEISYPIGGLSDFFERHRIMKRPRRVRHPKTDASAQTAIKK